MLQVSDIIKTNRITSRKQLRPGKSLIIPCLDFLPVSPHPAERMQVEAHSLEAGGSKQFGCLALSLHQVHFTPSNDNGEDAGISISTSQISRVRVGRGRAGDMQQQQQPTAVPDLLPAASLQRAGRSASQQSNGSNNRSIQNFLHTSSPLSYSKIIRAFVQWPSSKIYSMDQSISYGTHNISCFCLLRFNE